MDFFALTEYCLPHRKAFENLVFEDDIKFSDLDALEQFYVIKEATEYGEEGIKEYIKRYTPEEDGGCPYDQIAHEKI